ncbi:ComF family protein [Candidatus Peregrinibacteria bacterium]|nr:ComF family protein [Candidatus Peregrinibacteria bacterium]
MAPAEPVIEAANGNFAFERIIAAAPHKEGSPLAKLIHRFKYDGAQETGSTLAGFIREEWREVLPRDAVLVPVPLHKRRKLFRGFNQSEILAKGIGKTLNIRCENLLQRHIFTRPQVELEYKDRLSNLKGAFSPANSGYKCDQNATYILVDDVATTGTTLNECAKVLKSAGAKNIICLVVCRATISRKA